MVVRQDDPLHWFARELSLRSRENGVGSLVVQWGIDDREPARLPDHERVMGPSGAFLRKSDENRV